MLAMPWAAHSRLLLPRVSDFSGIEAISGIVDKYEKVGTKITLKHLSTDCKKLLNRTDKKYRSIILEEIDDPRYYVVADPNSFHESDAEA